MQQQCTSFNPQTLHRSIDQSIALDDKREALKSRGAARPLWPLFRSTFRLAISAPRNGTPPADRQPMETQVVDWLIDEADMAQQAAQEQEAAAPVVAELKVLLPDPESGDGAPIPMVRPLRLGVNRVGRFCVFVASNGLIIGLIDAWCCLCQLLASLQPTLAAESPSPTRTHLTTGRETVNDVAISHGGISEPHAELTCVEGGIVLLKVCMYVGMLLLRSGRDPPRNAAKPIERLLTPNSGHV